MVKCKCSLPLPLPPNYFPYGNLTSLQIYNHVLVRWTTHAAPETKLSGISLADVYMARYCDTLAWPGGGTCREVTGAKREVDMDWVDEALARLVEGVRKVRS